MLRKLLLVLSFVIIGSAITYAQTGGVKVKMTDKLLNEPIPFANVLVELGGNKAGIGQTNIDGEVIINNLAPGSYTIKCSFVGFAMKQIQGVIVSADKTTYIKADMSAESVELGPVEVVTYSKPLIDPETKSGQTFTREEFINLAQKNVNNIAAQAAGVYQADQGGGLSFRGSRGDATAYFVDGVRVIGALGVAQLGIEQLTVITGGIPAQYGDVTGGVISITTRGVPSQFTLGLQGESSQFLDNFGFNNFGFNVASPLLTKRDTAGKKTNVIGFSLSGDFTYRKDPDPVFVGTYKATDAVQANLEQNPLRKSQFSTGFLRNAEFLRLTDLEKIEFRQNVANMGINLNGKLVFRLSDNTDISVNGNYNYNNRNAFIFSNSLLNPANNPQVLDNSFRISTRLVQRFNTVKEEDKEKQNSFITNALFSLQLEYTRVNQTVQSENFKDDFFQYGNYGKFNRIKSRYNFWNGFGYQPNFAFNSAKGGFEQANLASDSLILFTPNPNNTIPSNYTTQFYNDRGVNSVRSLNDIQSSQGLLNGDAPGQIYSLFNNVGSVYNGFSKDQTDQFRVRTTFEAGFKNHNIQVGFEYEQQVLRSFSVSPLGLWTLMRQLQNSHLTQLDTANPASVSTVGPYDLYLYNPLYNAAAAAAQNQFDKSVRQKLGVPISNTDLINIDGMDPSFFSLNMFSPDQLFNNGSALTSYNGYNYDGTDQSGTPSFDKYFTDKDANGNFKREIGALQPNYIAGWIQDQFDIDDLKFRIGLRVDRFDANQKVLKDKYSLYQTRSVGEVTNFGAHPSNIASNSVVYVDDAKNPTKIVGYRNENTWYSPQGTEVANPDILAKNAGIAKLTPYLLDPNTTTVSSSAFKDFEPIINFMPRIAFAFPISDLAQFNANYDITTQRPEGSLATPAQYLAWSYGLGNTQLNPALQPQRTTNYELGYRQVLNEKKNSALTISAFYKELRNLINIRNIVGAYPIQYSTYDNLDFATVKGMSVGFDLRRTKNIQLNANYTLQFADGTGSNASDGLNLVQAGLPNLRTLIPLSYDRRHAINIVVDYRFGAKSDYSGPVITLNKGKEKEKVIKVFENVGFNLTFQAGSGTPYSRQSNVTQVLADGIAQRSITLGALNGSNLPWTYRMDLKIDKNISITWKSEKDGQAPRVGNLNVFISFLNLLNTQNVIGVYRYTGSFTDDGFLASPLGQTTIAAANDPTSYTDLYNLKAQNNTAFYTIPRSIRLGFFLDF